MLTCKQASELISQGLDRELQWSERVGLRLHLMMCRPCSRYARQLNFIQSALRQHPERLDEAEALLSPPIPKERQKRLETRISKELRQ